MKKILIITGDNADDSELLYPYYRMIEAGYTVDILSEKQGDILCKHGYKTVANVSVDEVDVQAYAGLILPGGMAPEKLRQDTRIVELVKAFFNLSLPIAAICHGPQLLMSAGILKGIKATCYSGIVDDLKNAGAVYVDQKMVCDHNVITSRRPQDLPYFMKQFMKVIG